MPAPLGVPLDEFVSEKVLEALKPAALELSLEAAKNLESEREELDRLSKMRLERAAYEVERAGRHYRLIEPENRLVGSNWPKTGKRSSPHNRSSKRTTGDSSTSSHVRSRKRSGNPSGYSRKTSRHCGSKKHH